MLRKPSVWRAAAASVVGVALLSASTVLPASAAAPTASFSGGTLVGGTRFAKGGDSLALTVSTDSDTKCVKVAGAFTAKESQPQGKSEWSFAHTAPASDAAADGSRSVDVSSYTNTPCNQGGQGRSNAASYTLDNTAPKLAGKATTQPNDFGWYQDDVTVGWTCDDGAGSGVASCPANSTITGEGGALSATASVSDRVGNGPTQATVSNIRIDRTPPNTTTTATSDWTKEDVTVTLVPNDGLSGVDKTYYILDGGDQETGTTVVISGEGVHTLSYWSVDKAGNAEVANSLTINIDKTDPTITSSQNPAAVKGWNNQASVTVSFTCEDEGGSAIKSCTLPVEVTDEGTSTVVGTAEDHAGNKATWPHEVKIDRTKPTIRAKLTGATPNDAGWYNAPVTVNYTCDDPKIGTEPGSGIAFCPEADPLNEGLGQSSSGTALDTAGNEDSTSVSGIDVDLTPPTTTSDAPSGWQAGEVTVTLSPSDNLSGVKATEYRIGSGDWLAGTSVLISGSGEHTLEFRSTDVADNVEDVNTATVKIDGTKPSVAITSPEDGTTVTTTSVTVSGTASDLHSGLASVTVNGEAVDVEAGSFSSNVSLDCDVNTITAVAADNVGHKSSDTITVSRSCNTAPSVSVTGVSDSADYEFGSVPAAGCDVTDAEDGDSNHAASLSAIDGPLASHGLGSRTATCTYTDKGGLSATPAEASYSIVDTTKPIVGLVGGPEDGKTYTFGSVPAAPACSKSDNVAVDGNCSVSGYNNAVGTHTVRADVKDVAGNEAEPATATYAVKAQWTRSGFYSPVTMDSTKVNTVRGGSTVPLKFELFDGSTELTSTSAVSGFNVYKTDCVSEVGDPVDYVTSGSTVLRYDTTDGQFIQNWKTPTTKGCYRASVAIADGGSPLSIRFEVR